MTNQQHPITPPPKLLKQWRDEAPTQFGLAREAYLTTQAAQWGADQELEVCYGWVEGSISTLEAAELRARIEALEAAQQKIRSSPAGSLVERVADALYDVPLDSKVEARAAILEVAAWLREQGIGAAGWAMRLESEADR
jgi:hypothetical protein